MSANQKPLLDEANELTSSLTDDSLRAALAVLWRAFLCAEDTGRNVWDLALSVNRLYAAGATITHLRWMAAHGLTEHGQEISDANDRHRSFGLSDSYFFNERTCLILTPSGAALAEHVFGEGARWPHAILFARGATSNQQRNLQTAAHEATSPVREVKPCWDATRRELSMSGLIVKRFRVPARNQETILSVFEEEGWAAHIHDPLPGKYDIDAPTRLHDAINRLNRCQVNPLLRFHGDGKGTGVFWELCRSHLFA